MKLEMMIKIGFMGLLSLLNAYGEPPAWAGNPDRKLEISMLPGAMKFNKATLEVEPGARVKLLLKNPDDLEHNWVLLKRDPKDLTGAQFAAMALAMGQKGPELAWTPDSPRVIAKSGMLAPKKEKTIYFQAPKEAGTYVYLCSFPGHSSLMRGELKVGRKIAAFTQLEYSTYKGNFSKLPDFSKLSPVSTGKSDVIKLRGVLKGEGVSAAVFQGTFELEKSGVYEFALGADDGARLSIDGEAVINNDGIHPYRVVRAKEKLEKGVHTMKVEYFDGGGDKRLSLTAALKGQKAIVYSDDRGNKPGRKRKPPPPILVEARVPGEAITFRTFFSGRSSRAIAVGYPGGVNLLWNADTMNLDVVWRGAFVNAGGNWHNRGSGASIAGRDQVVLGGGMSLQQLEHASSSWTDYNSAKIKYERDKRPEDINNQIPLGIPHPDFTFKGYELDAKRFPTFSYSFKGMAVTDFFKPISIEGIEGLERTLTWNGKAPAKTHLLLGAKATYEDRGKGWLDAGSGLLIKVIGAKPITREAEALSTAPIIAGAQIKNEKRKELLIPVMGDGSVSVQYRWDKPLASIKK